MAELGRRLSPPLFWGRSDFLGGFLLGGIVLIYKLNSKIGGI